MKKYITFYLLVGITLFSCTTKIPLTQTQNLHDGAVKVYQPHYSIKKRKIRPGLMLLGLGGIGFGLAVVNSQNNPNANLTKKGDEVGTGIYLGLLGTAAFIGSFAGKKKIRHSTEYVTEQNFDNWLRDYNRKNNINLAQYQRDGASYILIPKNKVIAYQTEEKRKKEEEEKQIASIKERQEKERIDQQERQERERLAQEEANKKAELEAYQLVVANNDKWIDYMKKYPTGVYVKEVLEKGEYSAYRNVFLFFKDSRRNYFYYFSDGKHIALVRRFAELSEKYEQISTSLDRHWLREPSHEAHCADLQSIKDFQPILDKWFVELKRTSPLDSTEIAKLQNSANFRIEIDLSIIQGRVNRGNKKIEAAQKFVIGDNICLNLNSHSIDENGKEIAGTDKKTLIRISIEEFNPEKTRMKIRVNDIFDVTNNRSFTGNYHFDNPKRIWNKGTIDWINPADWDLEICK